MTLVHQEQNFTAGVRFGSKGDMVAVLIDVRFTPKSGHRNSLAGCLLCAKSRHSAPQQNSDLFRRLVSNKAGPDFKLAFGPPGSPRDRAAGGAHANFLTRLFSLLSRT